MGGRRPHGATTRCPLDIDGLTVEGAQLRMTALRVRPDENVVIQLEFKRPGFKFRPACRIEWRPISGHNNKGLGPPEYRFKEIKTSHYHPFELNWSYRLGEMRAGNLKVAIPIVPDPPDFQSLLDFTGETLNINNIGLVSSPPWEGVLL